MPALGSKPSATPQLARRAFHNFLLIRYLPITNRDREELNGGCRPAVGVPLSWNSTHRSERSAIASSRFVPASPALETATFAFIPPGAGHTRLPAPYGDLNNSHCRHPKTTNADPWGSAFVTETRAIRPAGLRLLPCAWSWAHSLSRILEQGGRTTMPRHGIARLTRMPHPVGSWGAAALKSPKACESSVMKCAT